MAALACSARLKPVLAAAMSGCAMSSGSWAAAPIAPPRVSPAARASVSLNPLGMAVSIWLRYSAAPILPITAIPSAMPSSVAVSDVAEAAPALRAGAALTTMSVPRIIIGMTPTPMMVMPAISRGICDGFCTGSINSRPIDAITSPALTSFQWGSRPASLGTSNEAAVCSTAGGSITSPDSSGDRSSTPCRY